MHVVQCAHYAMCHSILTYRIACNFRGAKYLWFRVWKPDHEYITHEWSDLAYLYLQCKLQPRKYYPRNVSILLNHEYFVPRKLPAIRLYKIVMHWHNYPYIVILTQITSPISIWSDNYSSIRKWNKWCNELVEVSSCCYKYWHVQKLQLSLKTNKITS